MERVSGTVAFESIQALILAIDKILPELTLGEDNDGQVVIYTGLKLSEADELIVMEDAYEREA